MTPSGSLGPAVSTLRGRRACALMVPEPSTPEAPGPRLLGRVHEPPWRSMTPARPSTAPLISSPLANRGPAAARSPADRMSAS